MTHHQQQSTGREPQSNLYATAVDIPDENRVGMIQVLNQALADTTDLQSQAKFAHWNVKGYDFYQLHLLFDELAETLSEHVDLLAERATALGGQAMGTTRIAASTSRIPEPPENAVHEDEYLAWLADHVGQHANHLRLGIEQAAQCGDEDTADLFTELSRDVDKHLYFLESHLQSEVQTQIPATASQPSASGGQSGGAQESMGQAGRAQESMGQAGAAGPQTSAFGMQAGAGQAGGEQQATGQQATGQHGGAPAHEAAMRSLQGTAGTQSQSLPRQSRQHPQERQF